MKPLYELQQELNRLFIAGSKFAKNDPRLQKHIPILKKLGEKAPVFNKLAQDVEELLQLDAQQSAEKLLSLSTLLYSVLYTQGTTTEEGAAVAEQVPNVALADVNTQYSYLQLKPVLQALTQSNSGRLETVKDAYERGIFKDSRTFGYLSFALADKYSELADYIMEVVIPASGKAMLPFLVADFKLEDKVENVRRLRLLYKLGYAEVDALIDKIFAESLPNLQAEAIAILSDKKDEKTEDFIITLTGDKNKTVRGAAYKALAKIGTQRSVDKLYELYSNNKQKGNGELLAEAIASVPLASHYQSFLQKVRERFETLLSMDEADEKALTAAFERLPTEWEILKNKDYPETYALLGDILSDKRFNAMAKKRSASHYNIAPCLNEILNTLDDNKVLDFYEQYATNVFSNTWTSQLAVNYLYRVLDSKESFSKEKLYEVFAPQFNKAINARDMIEALAGTAYNYSYNGYKVRYFDRELLAKEKLDPRWADLLCNYLAGSRVDNSFNTDALMVLDRIEEDSERVNYLITKALDKSSAYTLERLYRLIIKRNMPNKFEILYESLAKMPKSNQYYYRTIVEDDDFWKPFPKEYAQKFRELHEKTKLDIFKEIAWQIEK
ncbi:HEAT repeat domain-containing protein [Capnocytophaga leadbetteri]|uniref:HEAT repeat domain-containing protein n=1 Tax=Capnocytophaga leadbetteri TaxID=327575 RepID=UPI0026F16284|nr:HEAT repeat domain-containing protein [Capnocytophaga leadbetteri]